MLLHAVTQAMLVALLLAAALWDVRKRRIPNLLSGAVLVVGLASAVAAEGLGKALSGLAAAGLCLGVLWWPWLAKRIGGGDVKLTAAAATALGLSEVPRYLLVMAMAAGVLALVCFGLSTSGARGQIATNLRLLAFGIMPEPPLRGGDGRVSVPFGVASAASAVTLVLLGRGW